MKTIFIQANKIKGKQEYQLSALSTDEIEHAIFIEITKDDIKDILEMMED